MPFYEYVCQACGDETEELQSINEAPLTKCEACGKKKLVKKVSAAGFRLSGSGWYETDFKKDKQKNLTAKDSAKADTGTAKTTEKTKPKADTASKKESKKPSSKAT